MLFNSIAFAVFLPAVFVLYWSIHRLGIRVQNALLLVASYVFYGWWDYRFLALIFVSSLIDYVIGLQFTRPVEPRHRKLLLASSLIANLSLLGFFKYAGFFVESLAAALGSAGISINMRTLEIVLPVGISFYTFQTLSYTIDLYRGRTQATRDAVAFFTFVSFFPQLVAGPIERSQNLLPQFLKERNFDTVRARDGARQILWGLFRKIVVADNLAGHVDLIFSSSATAGSVTLHLGVFLFAFQIYCDFSGYSDIAIGTARLFGFDLMRNFAYPYFSRDIAEFWRRWHISLSTWFRDYVYVPLGGSRTSRGRQLFNIIVTFVISGLWHGAAWTFVVWGLINGLYYIPVMLANRHRVHLDTPAGTFLPPWRDLVRMVVTFYFVLVAWAFFRAESLHHACRYVWRMVTLREAAGFSIAPTTVAPVLIYIAVLVAAEWSQRHREHVLQIESLPIAVRWSIYLIVAMSILLLGNFGEIQFIYFQF